MEEGLLKCEACKKEIAKSATKCPSCGSKTRMGKKKEAQYSAAICLPIGIMLPVMYFVLELEGLFSQQYITIMGIFCGVSVIWGLIQLIKSITPPAIDTRADQVAFM